MLRFGTHHCKNIAYFQIEFVSALDNTLHTLKRSRQEPAPMDVQNQHTYRLEWKPNKQAEDRDQQGRGDAAADDETYEIWLDGKKYSQGKIREDFEGFTLANSDARDLKFGHLKEAVIAVGFQIEAESPGIHIDDVLLETNEVDENDAIAEL